MVAPNCQIASRIIVGSTRSGLPIQPPRSIPKKLSELSTGPSSANIARHTIATDTDPPISDGA